ncbi:multicopper oxidase domain-containing protein [Oscillochloris sp. ZM17-4]|uniref:multicopper oxidase domain-containing protein n=1 Tax=Oscillochloris sp. ZM17-4 TaxID=2866714 RepID=UPI001C739F17|nr:multicopper oxidase domain-containing protein [Oscillochloris sp. ZM17-4]MBX0329235.1 multicopper oxidase domain-containing protein [Oscillochloris sp. ZM17-4]
MKRRLLPAILAALAILLVSVAQRGTAQAQSTAIPRNGVVCSTSTNGDPTMFDLTATIGYVTMSDGNAIHMWGYANGDWTADAATAAEHYQYPGPILCVNQGDTLTIRLHNMLPEDTSLIFPGQDNVQAGGFPSQPVFISGAMTSLAPVASAASGSGGNVTAGGTMEYSFLASEPGTYIYESGTNAGVQVQMGMFGTIIVRPSNAGFGYTYDIGSGDETQVAYAYNRADSAYNPAHENVEILSEIDPFMHQAYEADFINWMSTGEHNPQAFDMQGYVARYFLINGRSFPDTLADNLVPWLPNQPYSALVHIHAKSASDPYPALVRYVGAGTQDYPFHPHGNDSLVIGRDGRALVNASGADLSTYKFSIPVGPGQTWDITFDWQDDNNYSASNPIPVTVPQTANLTVGPYWSGSPYLGSSGALPPGGEGYSQCGEYYHIAHNHALQQMTSWGGITLSGQATYTRIDPPTPNSCPQQ